MKKQSVFTPKRPGSRENGEIDAVDAYQQEIWCSWTELFYAPEALASEINLTGGFLRIATPGMGLHEFAEKVNELKKQRMIPGPLRPQDLLWDGQDCRVLSAKLAKLMKHGTVDLWHLPGYECGHPAVLTADITTTCLLADTIHGRSISAYTGRVATLAEINAWDDTAATRIRSYSTTPAIVARSGVLLCGEENMPDRSVILRRIPDDGQAKVRARCPFCGRVIDVAGNLLDGEPRYNVGTYPQCGHVRLDIQDVDGTPHLAVTHVKIPEKHKHKSR
ncbi:MAG: hypothetical protein AB7E51_02275 [Pseudodesulfovibrio sp.]|uniref:hypothetical protein n=1 Tax=Pseudodesulfovibrio sp. TaxID=2035812 RepID=UPI003D0B8917